MHKIYSTLVSFQKVVNPVDEFVAMEVFGEDATFIIQEIIGWDGGDAEGLEEWGFVSLQMGGVEPTVGRIFGDGIFPGAVIRVEGVADDLEAFVVVFFPDRAEHFFVFNSAGTTPGSPEVDDGEAGAQEGINFFFCAITHGQGIIWEGVAFFDGEATVFNFAA